MADQQFGGAPLQATVEEFVEEVDTGGETGVGLDTGTQQANGAATTWTEEEWNQWNQWSWGWYWPQTSTAGYGPSASYSVVRESPVTQTSQAAGSGDVIRRDPLQESDPWQQRQPPATPWQADGWWGSGGWQQRSWGAAQDKWWAKGDYSEPPAWAGWAHYRMWRKSLVRWNNNTDVSMHRRAEKVLKGMEWSLQERLDHLTETELASPAYLDHILGILDVLAGEREDNEKRRTIRAALYEGARRSDESLAQYSLRRQSQFQSASRFLQLPDELKAFMMEEQAGLSKQGLQNLRVLTEGRHEYDSVRRALRIIDTEEESLFKSGKTSYLEMSNASQEPLAETDDEQDYKEMLLQSIDDKDLDEEQVNSFVSLWSTAATEEEAVNFLNQQLGPRRRTWSENKLLKAARKKDRRHFDDKGTRPARPLHHRRLPVSELKKVTRCSNCGERGHWREDCSKPYRSRTDRERTEKGASAFVFLGLGERRGSEGQSYGSYSNFGLNLAGSAISFLSIEPGKAIVDPGASQDLIGKNSYQKLTERLASVGLQPVPLPGTPAGASGVGGSAKPLFDSLVPCVLGGQPGIVKMTIVEEDIPQLLSIGLLETAGAIIDTSDNSIQFKHLKSRDQMERLSSGHRVLDIASWKGGTFPVPEAV